MSKEEPEPPKVGDIVGIFYFDEIILFYRKTL
jgi:hypothetical protein